MSTAANTPAARPSVYTPANAVGADRAGAAARTAAAKAKGTRKPATPTKPANSAKATPAAKPATPTTPATPATPTACRCGCGVPTKRPEANYLPGHDARHAGQIGREIAALDADAAAARLATLPSAALVTKATNVAEKAKREAAIRAARAAAKAALAEAIAAI